MDSHPMDVMRTGVSMLEPGNRTIFAEQQDVADRIFATLPAIICYWYRFSHDGVRIEENTDDDSIGAQVSSPIALVKNQMNCMNK